MQYEKTPALYRQLYALLLLLYPRPYRERFGTGMEQTFNDLCRERTSAGKGLFMFLLWVFSDTFIGLISVRISYIFSFMVMHSKHILRPALITALLLAVPLVAMQFSEDVQWTGSDFTIMGVIIFTMSLAYELISQRSSNALFRFATAIAILTSFLLVWVNLAVQIIGDGENPGTMLYVFVPLIGLIGAALARFQAPGMASAAYAAAVAQMLVPVITLMVWPPEIAAWGGPGVLGVFMLSAFFAMMYVFAGVLYRNAGQENKARVITA